MYSKRSALLSLVFLVSSWSSSLGFAPSSNNHHQRRRQSSTTNEEQKQHQPHFQPFSLNQHQRHHQRQLKQQKQQQRCHHHTSLTPLHMMSSSTTAAAAVVGALSGGLFAGGLHAIAGPDHLAALLPRCVGQRWYRASRIGAVWGMGHGISATLIGVVAFFCKNKMSQMGGGSFLDNSSFSSILLTKASSITEIAVGLSLIVIGLMGIKEAREWESEMESVQPQSLSAAAVDAGTTFQSAQKRAVLFNGLLHGFSWDGAPSLAPALAVATWRGNLAFLLAYALGTMGVMTVATTIIGEGTRRAGEVFHRPDIPQKLSFFSSILAMVIGVVWCVMPVIG